MLDPYSYGIDATGNIATKTLHGAAASFREEQVLSRPIHLTDPGWIEHRASADAACAQEHLPNVRVSQRLIYLQEVVHRPRTIEER